ncbi:MAG TPA: hypothetical protein VN631_18755 [Negativicutes bacterium]|nr:hypothetical protein [Negativicutes bacterium]
MNMLSRCLPLILLLVCMTATFAEASFPQNQWAFVDSPESADWSTQKSKLVGDYASIMGTLGMMVIQDGKVICSYGDVKKRSYLHSVRKSLLSCLIGIYVESGHIALSNTLASLGIDDVPSLTEPEKKARVVDLLKARSEVYHEAAAETKKMKAIRPLRGSHVPDTY